MANLQDLFNELQADDRVITPDTFEEFQSKMESPEYASRVNDVLKGHGYDVNAYEGLKKKEESMVESAPLSQQDSEQPSETTEPTQMGGTEPVGEVVSEEPQAETEEDLDPLKADLSAYNLEIKTPLSLNQNTPIQAAPQQQNVTEDSVMNESVDAPKPVNKYKNNDIISLAKNAKNKFISKHIDPIFSQAKQATAQFNQEIKPEEEALSQVEDGGPGDPKRKDIKDAATSLYNEMDDLNYKTASRVLGDTRVLGVKMDGDNYEVVFANNKMGGGDQGRSYKGKVGDVTWEGYISNAINSSDLYKDDESWEDLKSAVITQDTYSPELEGKKLSPSFNNNLASHKSKYFPQGSFGQITGTVTIPKEKNKEEEASFGTDLKRFFEKVKVKVKTQNIISKEDEERKEYNIAEETIPKTEYVMDTEQTFYNSLNNTPETNAIMQENALNFSDILLPSSKNKETVMEGIKLFLAKAGYDENEINQKSGVIYKQMLRDARYHAAEQYIRHEIENGNKTYKFQDIDRLNQAKEKGIDELMGDESLVIQSDKNFVSNVWDISLSDYINHHDAKATVRGRNMDIKNIPGKVSAYTARMNELEAQIEDEKVKLQIPSKEQLSETVKGLKSTKDKIDAYDAQLSKMEEDMNSLLVDQDGQKYYKDEASKTIYEELVAQSEKILNERNALVEQSKTGSQDIEKVNQFQNNISRQLKEYEALRKKLNYYDDDPDLLAMRGLSNTLTSIQNYESDKSAGIKNDLYDFQDYREKVRQDDEIARKEAEDDNMLEAGGKGLVGGFANALIGISKTGMYLGQVLTDEDSDQKEWTGGDELLAATSQLQENVGQSASNPYYEKWGLNWFVNGVGGVVPDLAAVYFTGGGAGFAELATTRGALGAVGKIATSPTTVYFTVRSTGDYAERLQKAGYSAGEAFLGGGLIAGTEAMLESLLPSFFNTTESISIKSFWKKTIEEGIAKKLAPEVIARQLKEGTIGIARNSGKLITTNTFNEKIEEGTQTLFTEVAFAGSTDETIQIFDPKTGGMGKTLEAVTEASAIGGAIGLVGSSAKGIRTLIKEKANNTTLKLTQLQIGRKYTEIINEADRLSKDFKGSEVEKEYEKINKEYKKLSANPNFTEYDDLAQSEILDKSLALNDLKEAQKNYESQNIVDVKLNNQIAEKEKELTSIINTAQENTDVRNDMNKQLEEIGVKSFTLNANGEVNGITFDEWTTSEEEKESTEKAIEIIEKVYKPKAQKNAVQEPSTTEVLPRQQGETTEAGGKREGVGPSVQGQGTTQEGGKEEIIATPKEAKEQEAMQNDIDQVQQSTGTVINLNEDGTLTINAPQRGGQSKKDAAIENAKQELTNLGYNVGSRVTQPVQEQTQQEKVQKEPTDEEFDNSIKEAESMGVVAGTQSMNDLQKRTAQDTKKGKIVSQASRAVKALKSLFPNMNIVLHESDESYNNAMGTLGGTANTRGQFVYKPSADGNIQGAVHINLDRANARTIAHEVTHAALLKMFKGDGKVFSNFKDKLKDIAKDRKMIIKDKDGNEVETTWGAEAEKLAEKYTDEKGFTSEDRAEEYLSELAGLVAELDVNKPENKSILKKIAEFINNFILSNPQLKALGITPISDTSSAEEVLEFFDTLGKKISRGEEIKTGNVNEVGEKPSSNEVTYKLQNDFSDPVSKLTFMYDKNSREFKNLEKQGYITNNKKLKDFAGKYLFLHQPDAAFSGMIYKNGELLVEGKGGVFYPIKFHKDGYFWASTDTTANKMAKDLNAVLKQNGGTIYMALTSAPFSKLMSSTTMSNAVLDFFSSKAVDKNFKINSKQLKSALLNAANHTKVKTTKNKKTGEVKQKQVGLDLGLSPKASLETIQAKIKESLGPDNSSFDDRKTFVLELTRIMAEEIKNDPAAVKQFGKLFSDGIQNKYFKGESKTGKLKISAANMVQAMSEMFTEPMLKEGVDRSKGGQVYAVLELKGKVKPVDSDKHESYPKAIQSDSDAKVKLHILKDRENWYDNFEDPTTGEIIQEDRRKKLFPTSGVSTMGLKLSPPSKKSGAKSTPKTKPGVVAKSQIDIDAEDSPLYQRRTKEDVPFVSNEQVQKDMPKMDADTLKTEAKGIKIEPGMLVGARINLRATRIGYPVLSLHYTFPTGSKTRKENTKASGGEVIASRGNVTLSNVNFNVGQGARENIAAGTATKGVMAMAVGRVMDVEPNFDGIELSFNPKREHLFVDANGRAVKSAEEVTVMGFKAYARGKITYLEEFEDPRSPKYTAPSRVTFAKTKEELVNMADDVQTGNTTVEEVGVPEVAPEVVAEAITAFSDAIENGSTIEEATEEVAIVLENSAEEGPRKVTPPSEKTEPVSENKKEEKPKAEEKEKTEGPTLNDSETIVAFTIAGNAKSIMDVEGVSQADAVNKAVLEMSNGDQESADRYLAQPGVKETIEKRIKQMKAKTARKLEAESNKVTISERKLLLDRVKAEIKAALEGRKEGKKEGVEQGREQAQKTIDALNKKLEEGKITKQELQDRIKELGYNIRWQAAEARLAGEIAGKKAGREEGRKEGIVEGKDLGRKMGKRFGQYLGYFRGLRAGRLEQKGLGAMVSDYIKDVVDNEFGKKGAISPATLKAISRRAATISNQKQLDAFVSYLDKIIANRRLAEGINEIQRQQKKLLNKLGYQYTTQMKQFAKFDLYTADGDLAFDMNTLEQYLQALQDLNLKVPNIGKMMQLFDGMNAINQSNLPADLDAVEEFKKYQDASTKLFQNTVINNFDDYKKFKREVNKYIRAVNNLLDLGAITELQHQSFLNSVVEGDAKYNTYAGQFQDEIDALKKTIIDGIVDKSTNSLWDSIKDWLTNSPNNFTRNQKKLIEQLQRVKADNLMTLSLDDLDLLNQVVTQIAENGFVDEKNLRSILDRAEIRGEKIGEKLISQSNKMSSKYKGTNAFMKMSLDLLNKSVVFWESRLGMKENGAFRKNVIDPITNAINGWTEDTQRILKSYRDSIVKLKLKGSYKVKTTKLEKGNIVSTGKTRKISKEAYRRVKIGVIGHILDNAWNAKQKKKVVNDWLGDQLRDNSARNAMADESIDELDIVQDVYNDLLQQFSDANGNLDHMAILEAFEDPQNQGSVMSADELEYYDAARTALQESGEYINSANAIRNKQHELNPYYMPRQSVGEGMGSITSNDISYNQELGTALRSSASYARTLQVPKEAIRFNVDRLVSVNVTEGLRDYYLTDAKRYVNEVFSNARENATNEEMDVLRNLQRLNNTRIPFALRKVQPAMIVSPLMNLFYTNALIGIYRTPVELINNMISYSLGNRSIKSIMPFSSKEKEQTNNLLSEFQSSVQFESPEKQTRFINKKWYQKGVNGYISTQKASQLLIPALNNISSFMRKGEWKTQFERAFENATGEKFNYEKHFVKEKAKYFDDMEQAASDADFNVRRIIKGGNKAEQRQFVQWVPLVKKGRIEADSNMAAFIGMFSGFIGHDVDNMTIGLRKAVKPGEVKDGVTQFLGAAMRLSLYPTLMLVAKSLGKMYFGDDDEKEEGKETLDTLKTPEGWADLALYTSKQLVSTSIMGKYAFGGKIVGNLLLHASYTLTEDRKQRRFIEDTMRELYFTDPIDLKYFNKDEWQLQMVANLEPITKMLADDIKDLVDDMNNKGREKVTLYDIYEMTQQTAEGKELLFLMNSIITLSQVTSIALTGTALPLIDDIAATVEDYLAEEKLDPKTTYETPGGQKIDMKDLILDTNGRLEVNMPGITPRDRDRLTALATEKFEELILSKNIEGTAGKMYAKLKFISDLAKYEAAKELGYSDKQWSDSEGQLVSAKPDWDLYPAKKVGPEVLREKLHSDIAKGKQLSFTQNLKEKRKIEDFLFKAMDNNPQLKQAYKDAPDGGKLGVREYYKDLYLYEKYKVTPRPKERDYFRVDGEGKIKQAESIPQEEN